MTTKSDGKIIGNACISIHTLRVEGDYLIPRFEPPPSISIHTLRVEGDVSYDATNGALRTVFQSTPSVWRVTIRSKVALASNLAISIHTLRVEGDLDEGASDIARAIFQSTPSVWRVTFSNRLRSVGV